MALTQSDFVSPEQYLAEEQLRQERHEYYDGLVYAMSGGSYAHSTLASNFQFLLKSHLKGSGCRASNSDMRLRVDVANCCFYPDVSVHCGQVEAAMLSLPSARIVVEVLSPSTAAYDQGRKFDIYRQLADLQEYVLVDSESRNVHVFHRADNGDWVFHGYSGSETIQLASIDFSVSLTELYDDTGIEE
ncbi:Uma2 family endonuclease [uncultured Deefgea sp.]|uniref:Uma2 family endonuclease n=1 Tax=uncultured Deefgea sp. TaxID=1304914 RepID=UPI0026347771|nr:Uma2 family endonuclease [uncultured Deefgea sp.]